MTPLIELHDVGKTFTLHLRGGARLPVVSGVRLAVSGGECVVLGGRSGAGKSSILKMIFGSYRCDRGRILLRGPDGPETDVAAASDREILRLRRSTIAYVTQFLRVIPRVATLDLVREPLLAAGLPEEAATARARDLLARLALPDRLWGLPPATFSGGEQQRVNIARGLAAPRPVVLLDEPTASLDAANRAVVVELIAERKREGAAILAVVHDDDVRERIADRIVDVSGFAAGCAGAAPGPDAAIAA